jgi:hypothetical protein
MPQPFGFGHLYTPFRPPEPTTLRAFSTVPFDIHAGMQACDPTCHSNPNGDALALVSNAGAQQFIVEAGRDRGSAKGPTGISLDDPDRDGYLEEITEGDLDVTEWYLLNHPAPARGRLTPEVRRGEWLFDRLGCTVCHVPDWHLPAAGTALAARGLAGGPSRERHEYRAAGDRRFFDLQVAFNPKAERLEGKLVSLADRKGDRWVPRRGPVAVRGVYSDFRYHDVGPAFYQMQFDGTLVKQWRTTPLWGVGSTAPYGHDGADLDLDSVIRRHGGEAQLSRDRYVGIPAGDRRDLIDFLNSLVLYQTDQLPCDLDGDGRVSEHFIVQGMDTGLERFNPEWLFRVPGKIEGPVRNVRGEPIVSFALTNVRLAYGLDLPYLKDSDGDGFPDVIDPAPHQPGFRDGVK